MSFYVLWFSGDRQGKIIVADGKGANLGEISKVERVRVRISTEAFERNIVETPSIAGTSEWP